MSQLLNHTGDLGIKDPPMKDVYRWLAVMYLSLRVYDLRQAVRHLQVRYVALSI
jgi:hypothetical protein